MRKVSYITVKLKSFPFFRSVSVCESVGTDWKLSQVRLALCVYQINHQQYAPARSRVMSLRVNQIQFKIAMNLSGTFYLRFYAVRREGCFC